MNKGQLIKQFFRYVSRSVYGMIGLSCYILADTFFIARGIGENALTALNLAIPVFSLITGVGLMIGVGGATLYSLRKDKGTFTQSFCLSVLASVFFMLCGGFFSTQLAQILGADQATLADTSVYIHTILLLSPFFLLNNLLSSFVRNDNAPNLAMNAMLAGSFSNIILDYVFIYTLDLGMFGAAIATCIAPMISLAILSLHFLRKNNSFSLVKTEFHFKSAAKIASLGLSSLITEFSSAVVIIVFNIIILDLTGNTGVAAYGIIANIALVVTSIFTGTAQGMQPLVSDLRRTNDDHGLKQIMRMGLLLGIIVSIAVYLLSFAFTGEIVEIFNSENSASLAEIAERGIRIYFTAYLAAGVNIITSASLSAADKPYSALFLSSLRGFALLVPSALELSKIFAMDGVWLSVPFTEYLSMILAFFFIRKIYKV